MGLLLSVMQFDSMFTYIFTEHKILEYSRNSNHNLHI